jgi:predicted dehydrogenase
LFYYQDENELSTAGKLRLAGIGCGYFSQFHYAAWQRLPVSLVAVADHDAGLAEASAAAHAVANSYSNVEDMVAAETIDLLDIVTPPPSHLPLIRLAAARGIDVICQKPFTQDLAEAREAVTIARKAGIRLLVHENFRFQPWYREIERLLRTQRLGEVYSAQFRLRPGDGQGADAYLSRQPGFQQMPRFLIRETGVHFVDLFRFLFGEVREVYANLRRLNPVIAGEDTGHVLMSFDNGVQAHFDANRLSDHAADNHRRTMGEFRIEGSDAELMLDGDAALRLRRHDSKNYTTSDYTWNDIGFGGDCVYLLQKHVIEAIVQDHDIENTAADYLRNLEVVEAIYKSAECGQRIALT